MQVVSEPWLGKVIKATKLSILVEQHLCGQSSGKGQEAAVVAAADHAGWWRQGDGGREVAGGGSSRSYGHLQ